MSEADEAYAAAEAEIARVAEAGEPHLSFDHDSFRALDRLPPSLTALTNLQMLVLKHTQVSDFTALAALTGLTTLWLDGTPISDLTPLGALTRLEYLALHGTQVNDLAPLARLTGLHSLGLTNTRVSDLAPLAELTGLEYLGLAGSPVSDLAPLANLRRLHTLWLNVTQVSDLRPIAELDRLGEFKTRGGLSYRDTLAIRRDARLATLAQIKGHTKRTRETLAYLRSLPPWPEPYTPEATPDGSPPQPIGGTPAAPEQDPALPLIWGENGFAFLAASIDADPVTEAALDDLRALLDDLRRKGNRHDDLYRLAGELQARSAGAVPDLHMVRLHLSYQKLRRLHANRAARDDPFDAETLATIEAVFDVLPGVTLADAGVRTLIERQDAERATPPPAAQAEAAGRVLQAVQEPDAPFTPEVKDIAAETLRPGADDRLSGLRRILSGNVVISALRYVGATAVGGAIGGPVGNFVYDHGTDLLAYAATMGGDALVWAQSVLSKFRVEYELAIGTARDAAGGAPPSLGRHRRERPR